MHSRSLLLIEDDHLLGPLYAELLAQAGYDLKHATHACEALTLITQESFELILLDIMLPEVSGVELLSLCKDYYTLQKKRLPTTIVLSNLHQRTLQEQLLGAGATAFLVKSEHTPGEFLEAINSHLSPDVLP